MATLSENINPETLKAILDNEGLSATDGKNKEVPVDPLDAIGKTFKEAGEGEVPFGEAFWTTTKIIDPSLPIKTFNKEDWHEDAQLYIPTVNPHWEWNKEATEKFALAMYCGDTTLLHGLQGTGKSCLAEQWCAKFNIPFWRMSCNRETREGHFLGAPSVEYNEEGQMFIKQEPTVLTESLKYGGIFVEDEAFRHNSALVLQSLREKSSRYVLLPDAPGRSAADRKLTAPEGRWWYVLTDNTCGLGDHTGTFDAQVQDVSTLDRVDSAIEVTYLPPVAEKKILKRATSLDESIQRNMVKFAGLIRSAFASDKILVTFSVRALLAWAEKTAIVGNVGAALQQTWFDKLSEDDKAVAKDAFHQVFARHITD